MSGTESEYSTESSSDELSGSDNESSTVTQQLQYPYPFFGHPYVTKSILNTIDAELLSSVCREVAHYKVKCLQFKVKPGKREYSLSHILFGDNAVSFSKVAG